MDILRDIHIDFMKYRKFWIVVSLAFLAVGVFSIFVHGQLNVGIDFAGGTQLTIKFLEEPDLGELRETIAGAGVSEAQLQLFGEASEHMVIVKAPLVEGSEEGSREKIVRALDERYAAGASGIDLNRAGLAELVPLVLGQGGVEIRSEADAARLADAEAVAQAVLDARRSAGLFTGWDEIAAVAGVSPDLLARLQANGYLGQFTLLGVESVGPQIGEELRQRGFWAVILSLLGIMGYLWIRFELRFAIGALMASIHDVLVTLGLFALLDFEFNLTTIAAFLTLVGYSVNDTVVIFDRVRENMRKSRRRSLLEILNEAINQTLSRTILTSGTTLLATLALLIAGGEVLRGFAFVLTVGVVVGTYSTIYIAGAFTLLWEQLLGTEARARRADRTAKAA